VAKALRCGLDGSVQFDLITPLDDVWTTFRMAQYTADLAAWTESGIGNSPFFEVDVGDYSAFPVILEVNGTAPGWDDQTGNTGTTPLPVAEAWQDCEVHSKPDFTFDFYVGGVLVFSGAGIGVPDLAAHFFFGNFRAYNPSVVYYDDVKIGTTRGGADLFSDDFESGDLSAWSNVVGDATVVESPTFTPPTMNPGRRVGIAFDSGPLDPVLVRDGVRHEEREAGTHRPNRNRDSDRLRQRPQAGVVR